MALLYRYEEPQPSPDDDPLPGGAPGMISSATARASRTWVEATAGRCELVRGRGPQDRVIAVKRADPAGQYRVIAQR